VKALVWLRAESWEALAHAAATLLPADAEVTLLHVADAGAELAAEAPAAGLLGRRRPKGRAGRAGRAGPHHTIEAISDEAAAELLASAAERLGREVATEARRGRLEDVVMEAAEDADVLLCARDGDRDHRGPKSLAPPTRFVVDHVPCTVVLAWPEAPPGGGPPPPPEGGPPPPPPPSPEGGPPPPPHHRRP
jgi:nucleotide-binding universal stress UspA family protein